VVKKVLVTGAFGFLGRHVARACARAGYSVSGIGHGSWSRAEWREWGLSQWHVANVNQDTLASYGGKPDLIIHCAGSGSVAFSLSHPSQDFDRSVLTTRDVLEYIRLHHPSACIVLPSSASVYGNATQVPIPVTAPLCPVSPYGANKKMAEDLCLAYSRHFGISVVIVRLFSVYGIGLRKQLLWDACTKLSLGPWTFGGTGDETRDWLHVEDAARLLLSAGVSNISRELIVNGGTGVGITTRKIVETLAKAFNGVECVRFTGKARPGDPLHLVSDMECLSSLSCQATKSLEAELDLYAAWFKSLSR
jgi:UDP-glucose 4-epimerase